MKTQDFSDWALQKKMAKKQLLKKVFPTTVRTIVIHIDYGMTWQLKIFALQKKLMLNSALQMAK